MAICTKLLTLYLTIAFEWSSLHVAEQSLSAANSRCLYPTTINMPHYFRTQIRSRHIIPQDQRTKLAPRTWRAMRIAQTLIEQYRHVGNGSRKKHGREPNNKSFPPVKYRGSYAKVHCAAQGNTHKESLWQGRRTETHLSSSRIKCRAEQDLNDSSFSSSQW